jgi:hydroxymethylbilane synthase
VTQIRRQSRTLKIATRGSKLALWQAHAVASRLLAVGVDTDILTFTTTGDRSQHGRVAGDDSKRQFVKELEDALLRGEADLAVHSAKDLPVELPDGLVVAACLAREDPRDALVLPGHTGTLSVAEAFASMKAGATIGTGSVRRVAQLRPLVPEATFSPVRGNVDTRLAKLDAGAFDAIVLACAGLRRLGFGARITAPLPLDQCVPAPGQGIVATEIRRDDDETRAVLDRVHDHGAGTALEAERAVVAFLGGGCQLPLGAVAEERDGTLHLRAIVASADGKRRIVKSMSGPRTAPQQLGRRVAEALAAEGARALLDEVESS